MKPLKGFRPDDAAVTNAVWSEAMAVWRTWTVALAGLQEVKAA